MLLVFFSQNICCNKDLLKSFSNTDNRKHDTRNTSVPLSGTLHEFNKVQMIKNVPKPSLQCLSKPGIRLVQ